MKKILFSVIVVAALAACDDANNTASEGYVDSTNVTPTDQTGLDTSSRMGTDTSMMMGTDTNRMDTLQRQ